MSEIASVRQLIFWGGTGQAKVLAEILVTAAPPLTAIFDNDPKAVSPIAGVPLYHGDAGFRHWLASVADPHTVGFLVAIGGDRGQIRLELQDGLARHGLQPWTAVHHTAFVAPSACIGNGSQILAQASVCVEARLGRGCIVNTAASVDHEYQLGDGVHVMPGARLAGCVTVERYASIGTGAVVLPRLTIGEGAVIGAGAVVTRDVPAYTVVIGNPARIMREIDRGTT